MERAADWLFSHADELDKLLSDSQSDDSKPSEQQLRDGCGSKTSYDICNGLGRYNDKPVVRSIGNSSINRCCLSE